MAHIKFNKIIHKTSKGFSLVEVLISLAIISSAILIILTSVASATKQATFNKLKMEMINSATGILAKTQNVLYNQYKDQDWNSLLSGNIQLATQTSNGEAIDIIQSVPAQCVPNQNPLNQSCPTVENVLNNIDYLSYVIHAEQQGTQNVYKLTITVACKDNTKCDPNKLAPVQMEMYVIKY